MQKALGTHKVSLDFYDCIFLNSVILLLIFSIKKGWVLVKGDGGS